MAAEAGSRSAVNWIRDRFGNPARKHRPPPRKGLRRKLLSRTPKPLASRYYQLLTGHAAMGFYLKDKIHKAVDDECWWFFLF